MVSDTGRPPTPVRRRRRRRLAAAIAVASCAPGLAFLPAATARRADPTAASAPTPTPAPTQASAKPGRAGAKPAPSSQPVAPAAATSPAPAASPSARRAHEQAAAETTPGTDPTRRQERIRQRETARAQAGAGAQSAEGQEAGVQPAVTTPDSSAARKHGGGHHKEGSSEGKHGREPHRGKGRSGKGTGSGSTGSGEGAGGNEPPATTPALVASVQTPALVSAPVATPAVATAPVHATSAPAGASTTPAVGHAPRRAKRSRRARAGAHATTPAVAGLVPAAATTSAATPKRTPPRARKGAPNSKAAASSPLVTTITKIVDVVPTPIRGLIAALLALAIALAVRSRVSALRARRLERQRAQLLEDVGLLQAALLPVPPARLGPVATSVAYQPAAGPGAGGDFYDVFALDDGQLAIIVGDVSGHGRQALPHTALVRFTLRAYLEAGLSPRDAVQTAGAVLERQLGGAFATVVAATYNPRERLLVYSCAGHPPPLVLPAHADAGSVPPVTICASPPIGVGMRTGTRQTVIAVPGGAQICFHTDGVTEARVGSELFGAERLVETLTELGPSASAPALLERVAARADARPDDMAACMLHIEGEDEAPTVLVEELELDRQEASSARAERFLLACGVEREDVADVLRSAASAAGRVGTIVLEVRRGEGSPEVSLRREHLAYIHARRGDVGVAL
jgi:serine phosphatase RsbU (regulator of sigma subunit)